MRSHIGPPNHVREGLQHFAARGFGQVHIDLEPPKIWQGSAMLHRLKLWHGSALELCDHSEIG